MCSSDLVYAQTVDEVADRLKAYTDSTRAHSRIKLTYLEIDQESAIKLFDKEASFGMFRDNYFITGAPTNKRITKENADVKFQISIRQRLTKSVLPFNTFLMLTYTQKSFWDMYDSSAPFRDNNFNPGLMLAKPIISDNKLKGMAYMALEHESNGKGGEESRSWNYLVFSGAHFLNARISVQAKFWAGWLSSDNKDLYNYRGIGILAFNYRTLDERFVLSAVLNPRKQVWKVNTQLEMSYKVTPKSNQYIFLQWFQGYAENLLEYNQYSSMVRIGICIKPKLHNLY